MRPLAFPIVRALAVAIGIATALTGIRASPRLQSPAGTPSSVIFGRVVDAETDRPIGGVLVTLIGGSSNAGRPAGGGPQRALTDGAGRYVFHDVPKGTYTLSANVGSNGYSPSGFIVIGLGQQIGAYLNGGYGQRRPDGALATLDVADGVVLTDVVIRLWKGAAIEGLVVDETDEPMVGVVIAAARRDSSGRLSTGPSTRTDDRGWFRLPTLKPGTYVVVVPQKQNIFPAASLAAIAEAPANSPASRPFGDTMGNAQAVPGVRVGSMVLSSTSLTDLTNLLPPVARADGMQVYTTTFYPSSPTAARATLVRLGPGETRSGLVLMLEPRSAVKVSGTLSDEAGPVPNFGIRLMPAASDGSNVLEVATTATDARGAFEFPLVPPGSYTLRAERNLPAGGRGTQPRVSDAIGVFAAAPLAVANVAIEGISLVLRPGARVKGRVDYVGATPAPTGTRAVSFSLIPAPPVYRSATIHGSVVDEHQGLMFSAVAPGRYLITVSAVSPWTLASMSIDGRDVTDGPVEITSDISDLAVVLTDSPASIRGTARSSAAPVGDDVSAFLFPQDRSKWADAFINTRAFQTVRVSTSGAFVFSPVVPGHYLVAVVRETPSLQWPDPAVLSQLETMGMPVNAESGRATAVALEVGVLR